jgi:hypothetical protein
MTTLKESAKAYVPKQTLNIADLPEVSVDLDLQDGEGTDNEGKPFKYKFIQINGQDYRVPGSVIGDLKAMLEEKPNMTKFKVTKKGAGMNTRYTIIPLA